MRRLKTHEIDRALTYWNRTHAALSAFRLAHDAETGEGPGRGLTPKHERERGEYDLKSRSRLSPPAGFLDWPSVFAAMVEHGQCVRSASEMPGMEAEISVLR